MRKPPVAVEASTVAANASIVGRGERHRTGHEISDVHTHKCHQ
jgi:hypothetical protein